jgi:hypothetical protein
LKALVNFIFRLKNNAINTIKTGTHRNEVILCKFKFSTLRSLNNNPIFKGIALAIEISPTAVSKPNIKSKRLSFLATIVQGRYPNLNNLLPDYT